MLTETAEDRLWALVQWQPYVDANKLLAAVDAAAQAHPDDVRTRVLLRDSYRALARRWGEGRVRAALSVGAIAQLDAILRQDLGDRGFASLEHSLVEPLDPEALLNFFRDLGESVREPVNLYVGGSSALILGGYLQRNTDDVDVVDELPRPVRTDHELIERLVNRHRLRLSHFQSHYLPTTWANRAHSLGWFGRAHVTLVDVYDIFVGKLFSKRDKDFVDLRVLKPKLDQQTLAERVRNHAAPLADDPGMRQAAEHNWYVLFGQPLPEIQK